MSGAEETSRHRSYIRRVLIALGFATAFVVLLFVIWRIGDALLVIFASCLFAIFLSGCARWISQRTSMAYGWSLLLIVVLLISVFAAVFTSFGVQIAQQATQLYEGLQATVLDGRDWMEQFALGEELLDQAEGGELELTKMTAPVMRVLRNGLEGITLGIMILIIGLYLAGTPQLYQRGFLRLIPVAKRSRGQEVLNALMRALQGWLLAQFVSMAVIGTLVAVGLWAFGIELWLILGLLAGVLTFIPNLGPIMAGIPPVLLALNQSAWLALGVLAYFTAVQFLEGYFVTPMVQHRVIRLPPAAILSIQLLMGYAFGFIGIAVAAPLLAALMVIIEMLYVQDILGDRNIKVTGQESRLWSRSVPDEARDDE